MNEKFNVYFFNRLLYYGITILVGSIIIWILSTIGLLAKIGNIFSALLPVFLAIFISYILEPIIKYLESKRIRRVFGVPLVYTILISIIFFFLYIIIPNLIMQIKDFFANLPALIVAADKIIDNITKDFNINIQFKDIIVKVFNGFSDSLLKSLNKVASSVLAVLIAITGAILLSLDFDKFKKSIKSLMPIKYKERIISYLSEFLPFIHRYITGLLLDNAILFGIATVVFWLAGAKYPFLFGLVVAITNFIPIIGQFIGGIPIVLIGFSVSIEMGIIFLIIIVILQFFESNILQPIILRNTLKLMPIETLIGVLLFGKIFGFMGMVASPIIMISIKILYKNLKRNKEIEK